MSMRKTVFGASALMLMLLFVSGFVGATLFNEVRMGGPLQLETQEASDLVADILPPPEYVLEPYLEAAHLMLEPERASAIAERLKTLRADYDTRHVYWEKSAIAPDVREAIVVATHQPALRFWDELENRLLPAAQRDDRAAMQASYRALSTAYAEHRTAVDRTVKLALAYRATIDAKAAASLRRTNIILATLGTLLALVALGFSALMIRRVLRPLIGMTARMERMGRGETVDSGRDQARRDEIGAAERALAGIVTFTEARAREDSERQGQVQTAVVTRLGQGLADLRNGRLDHRIGADFPSEYSALRDDFNATVEAMRETIGAVIEAVGRLGISAGEINSATEDLASRNEAQAGHLKNTSEAVQELNGHVRATAQAANSAAATVQKAESEATANAEVVGSAISAMRDIEAGTRDIVSITEVIDRLANQTHLLSLNASVEAARAGAAGKGFAVVSEEVRALAQNSGKAAHQIKDMIDASTVKVSSGVALVDQSGQAMDGLLGRLREMSGLVGEIAGAARDQAGRLESIAGAIGSIDQVTQQNAAMSEECSAAARLLNSEAANLSALTSRFTLTGANEWPTIRQPRLAA